MRLGRAPRERAFDPTRTGVRAEEQAFERERAFLYSNWKKKEQAFAAPQAGESRSRVTQSRAIAGRVAVTAFQRSRHGRGGVACGSRVAFALPIAVPQGLANARSSQANSKNANGRSRTDVRGRRGRWSRVQYATQGAEGRKQSEGSDKSKPSCYHVYIIYSRKGHWLLYFLFSAGARAVAI